MRFALLAVSALVASSGASPALLPDILHAIFSPPKLPAFYIPQLYPLLFPTANYVGVLLSPLLRGLVGDRLLEEIDTTADFFCVAAGNDPSGKGGICQQILARLYKLGISLTPASQAALFKELAFTLCVAPNTQPPLGTCQAILELADCIANRILQTKDLECTPEQEPEEGDDDDEKVKL
ncbi:hypothetical protein Hypma_001264 [Hypsizygus marmoreus]|uniref:Uncharacterized protein n=1 Tax=Hypsizygus marmoreus TaxID=39966 RepID=A0A369JCS6_HYPMA|nr:hypothetical protein Hypma_001264 [Hypsizygus marmoreus]